MKPTTIVIDGSKVKRIAVTCKCGNRFVESIPGEVLDGGAAPVFTCQCGQDYLFHHGKLRRMEFGQIGKLIEKKDPELNEPVDAELADGVQPQDHKAWEMPGSKLVN